MARDAMFDGTMEEDVGEVFPFVCSVVQKKSKDIVDLRQRNLRTDQNKMLVQKREQTLTFCRRYKREKMEKEGKPPTCDPGRRIPTYASRPPNSSYFHYGSETL